MNSEDNEEWDIHQRLTTPHKVIQEHIEFILLCLQNQLNCCCCPLFSCHFTIIIPRMYRYIFSYLLILILYLHEESQYVAIQMHNTF